MNYDIVIIGEVCYDTFILGNVNRLSPEAPVPIINPLQTIQNYGMAGNVYANISSLNHTLNIKQIFQNKQVINKIRYVDKNSGYILLRVDENDKIEQRIDIDAFYKFIEENTLTLKAIVISDYNKGFLSEEDIQIISELGTLKNIPVFLDTKKILGNWSLQVDFVKINEKEYNLQKQHLNIPKDFCKNLIVTRGAEGSHWLNNNLMIPTEKSEVRDVVGAGDTYLSAFVVNYIENKDIIKAMIYANKAATYAVSKQGVYVVKKEDII